MEETPVLDETPVEFQTWYDYVTDPTVTLTPGLLSRVVQELAAAAEEAADAGRFVNIDRVAQNLAEYTGYLRDVGELRDALTLSLLAAPGADPTAKCVIDAVRQCLFSDSAANEEARNRAHPPLPRDQIEPAYTVESSALFAIASLWQHGLPDVPERLSAAGFQVLAQWTHPLIMAEIANGVVLDLEAIAVRCAAAAGTGDVEQVLTQIVACMPPLSEVEGATARTLWQTLDGLTGKRPAVLTAWTAAAEQ